MVSSFLGVAWVLSPLAPPRRTPPLSRETSVYLKAQMYMRTFIKRPSSKRPQTTLTPMHSNPFCPSPRKNLTLSAYMPQVSQLPPSKQTTSHQPPPPSPHPKPPQLPHSPQPSLEIPIIMPPLPMFPKDRIPVLIVRLPHLSFLFTNGIIPRITPCSMSIRSTRVYGHALAISPCALGVVSMVLWPVAVCILVVWLLSAGGMVRRARERRGVTGLGAAHCERRVYSIWRSRGLCGVRDSAAGLGNSNTRRHREC